MKTDNDEIDLIIINIIEILQRNKIKYYSEMLSNILEIKENKGSEEFQLALNSNDLWGGSGSLADSALYHSPNRISESDVVSFNTEMTKLGEYIIKNIPNSNRRIPFWADLKQ